MTTNANNQQISAKSASICLCVSKTAFLRRLLAVCYFVILGELFLELFDILKGYLLVSTQRLPANFSCLFKMVPTFA